VARHDPSDEPIACGRVRRAHGLRGEVVVDPWTDAPAERFAAGATLRTQPETNGPLTVESAYERQGRWIIAFEGVADRTAAEALRGTVLLVRRGHRRAIEDPDEFYDTDLVGLTVRDRAGAVVGTVVEVVHGPGGDSLAVENREREHLVPFVSAIVPSVDVAAGVVVIDPPEGLLEL
jgi:16S rRNA processing protein RimM